MLQLSQLSPSQPLLIFDLANNHNGSVSHGKKIINEIASMTIPSNFQVAIKFQYRDLPNFIHPDFRDRRDLKYVDRFLSTQLEWNQFLELREHIKLQGFLAACTPFDEYSVTKVLEHKFDILKIASASFTDWSLLEEIGRLWSGPIVASTAGVTLREVDRVVAFLKNRNKDFALMHCVAAYPTSDSDLQLNRISVLKNRYGSFPVGYSTHEDPKNQLAAPIALAAGAVILERHVGSIQDGVSLNKYSSDSEQIKSWIINLQNAITMLGAENPNEIHNQEEQEALSGLRRYAFLKTGIEEQKVITQNDIFFGIPGQKNQLQANDIGKYLRMKSLKAISAGQALTLENTSIVADDDEILQIRDRVLRLITESGTVIPKNSILEISHHYGLPEFYKFGVSMITVVNREYCKKILVCLPGQIHPPMVHKIKDETFFLLHGDLSLELDNQPVPIELGQTVEIVPGTIHGFSSKNGAVIEEVSSSHSTDDSYYVDENISLNKNRKTFVQYWL